MNGKQAKAIRKLSASRAAYQAAKRAFLADQGQNAKPPAQRKRRRLVAIPATWPRTEDQCKQSRPVIVRHPVKTLLADKVWNKGMRALLGQIPKADLDGAATHGWPQWIPTKWRTNR